MNKLTDFFEKFARIIAQYSGRPVTFFIAFSIVIAWGASGPLFGFSDTWQLVINTGTTIITFLMVFLVQSAQNRDSKALQLKLDELILKISPADNLMIDIQELTERELDALAEKYKKYRTLQENTKTIKKQKPGGKKQSELDKIMEADKQNRPNRKNTVEQKQQIKDNLTLI